MYVVLEFIYLSVMFNIVDNCLNSFVLSAKYIQTCAKYLTTPIIFRIVSV